MKFAPFEEIQNGLPLWRLQVQDPAAAARSEMQFYCRQLRLPHGPVFALALSLQDGPGKPLLFHHALITASPGFSNLKKAGSALIAFERYGFISGGERKANVDFRSLDPDFSGTEKALADYVGLWRREMPGGGSPAEIWDRMEKSKLRATRSVAARGGMVLLLLLILLAAAAVLAWMYLPEFHALVARYLK